MSKYTPKTVSAQSCFHRDKNCGKMKGEALERTDNYIEYHGLHECPVCGQTEKE
jgi:hypothetical protein